MRFSTSSFRSTWKKVLADGAARYQSRRSHLRAISGGGQAADPRLHAGVDGSERERSGHDACATVCVVVRNDHLAPEPRTGKELHKISRADRNRTSATRCRSRRTDL